MCKGGGGMRDEIRVVAWGVVKQLVPILLVIGYLFLPSQCS